MFLFSKNTPRIKPNFIETQCCAFLVLLSMITTIYAVDVDVNGDPKTQTERDAHITLYRVAPADELGIYKYAYSTSNGIEVQTAGSPLEAIGIYSYISPEGIPIEVRYIADELGFHAVGRHLPRPPPIPSYILRSLEYIRTHPNSENRGANRKWK